MKAAALAALALVLAGCSGSPTLPYDSSPVVQEGSGHVNPSPTTSPSGPASSSDAGGVLNDPSTPAEAGSSGPTGGGSDAGAPNEADGASSDSATSSTDADAGDATAQPDSGVTDTGSQMATDSGPSGADAAGPPCTVPSLGSGECMLTTDCAALPGYVSTPGYCPGAADIQCCTGPTDAGGGGPDSGTDSGTGGGTAPTWTELFTNYLASGTVGDCGNCHGSMNTPSNAYSWLQGRGYVGGASPSLAQSGGSCLSWFGGNMPPSGATSAQAVTDFAAWALAGGQDN